MPNRILLEICVESSGHAAAAEAGGADRIEICTELSCGGITPAAGIMQAVRRGVTIPVHALIRPRAGGFCYSKFEFDTMKREIETAKEFGMNGVVLGILAHDQQVDRERTRELVQFASPAPVTFHRAFDRCPDIAAALETVIETGATRILTSGGKSDVVAGIASLKRLVAAAGQRIAIMPGGGVRAENIEQVLRRTGAREIHTSLGAGQMQGSLFEAEVRRFKLALERAFP